MYTLIRQLFFLYDAETAHYKAMHLLSKYGANKRIRNKIIAHCRPLPQLAPINVAGLAFSNGVGLAAGFDKNAQWLTQLSWLGFGFIEIGTVTPLPQEGNEKPRLFRLKEDKALINRMGFNNEGADAVAARLQAWRKTQPNYGTTRPLIIGGNIGKNKSTPNGYAYMDYDACYRKLAPWVDYVVINVSSPNTPGLRDLQSVRELEQILVHMLELRVQTGVQKPLFLKIAPDLQNDEIEEIGRLAQQIGLDGIVACNTTIDRHTLSDAGRIRAGEIGQGGLSGVPVGHRATEVVRLLKQIPGFQLPIIASGGVFTGADYAEKIAAGASLVQVWTGFIYKGPTLVRQISEGF